VIVLGGDWLDCEELHKSSAGKRQALGLPKHSGWSVMEEIVAMRVILAHIRRLCPNSRIIYTIGNHEERIPRTVASQLPQLWQSVPSLAQLLETDQHGVEVCQFLEANGWVIYHGHRFGVNPHRLTMQDNLGSVLIAHGHGAKMVSQTNLTGSRQCWGVMSPALCRVEAHYMQRIVPDWQQGWTTLDPLAGEWVPTIHYVRHGQSIGVDGNRVQREVWEAVDAARRDWLLSEKGL